MTFAGRVYDTPTVRLEVTSTGLESDGALHEMRATYRPDSPFPPPYLHPDRDEVQTATAAQDWTRLQAALREHRDVFRLVPDPFADA